MIVMHWSDWFGLFTHYLLLSLMAIGGAITTAPDMHRYLVDEHHLMTGDQFTASISIAQAAPGPNILFVALMGWNVGMNTNSLWAALFGMLVTMTGILLPSATLTYFTAQWGYRNRELRAVRAFKQGMSPLVLALLIATGWLLATANTTSADWRIWILVAASTLIVWRTRIHLLWLLAAGAILGWFGLV